MRGFWHLGWLLVLAACGAAEPQSIDPPFTRIVEEAEFKRLVVGKTLSDAQGSVVLSANGTFDGRFRAGRFHGTWKWEDGYFCREGRYGHGLIRQDCKLIEIHEDMLHLTGAKGIGQRVVFRIN